MTVIQRTDKFMADHFGDQAWRVGGSVRDEIRGHKPKDADFVVQGHTLAKLNGVLVRAGTKPVLLKDRAGRKLGFRVRPKGLPKIEIALPRTEVKKDNAVGNERHNFEFIIDPNLPLAEDAKRRDFTFNAIFRNAATGEIHDPLGGKLAIEDKLIETTHENSFADDPLRILRALRFVATLRFTLDGETRGQMKRHAPAMAGGLTDKAVSGTVLDEVCKMLMGDNVADALRAARDTGALVQIFPELEPLIGFQQENEHHDLTGDEHTFMALDAAARMDAPLRVRIALLFHDAGKPLVAWKGADGKLHFFAIPKKEEDRLVAEGVEVTDLNRTDHAVASAQLLRKALERLNADRKLRRDCPLLVERHMVPLSMKVKPAKVRKWRTELGDDLLADLFKHRLCDCMGKMAVPYSDLEAIARLEAIREEAQEDGVPASAKDMKDMGLIDGHDLIEMGIEGSEISRVLAQILHEVVSQPSRMDRDWALLRAAKLGGKA